MKDDKKPIAAPLPTKTIQLRDVNGQLHAAVKGKAASLGITMEAFILRLMEQGVK
jgi:hypothetical protein